MILAQSTNHTQAKSIHPTGTGVFWTENLGLHVCVQTATRIVNKYTSPGDNQESTQNPKHHSIAIIKLPVYIFYILTFLVGVNVAGG
jgi:hypothetical protein